MEIFIAILAIIALILVHEFGHFIVAKWVGMRVDEFGLGYPPRACVLGKRGDTLYTLNWLPFGGFVKIYGEDLAEQESPPSPSATAGTAGSENQNSFSSKSRTAQALVLVAGVAMNFLVAYLLITGALITGTPRVLSDADLLHATRTQLAVTQVLPDSPAASAQFMAGDVIESGVSAQGSWRASDPKSFQTFINEGKGARVTLSINRAGQLLSREVTPVAELIASDPSRYALGVSIATIGVVPVSFSEALTEGARLTWEVTKISADGLYHFFANLATFSADFSQVAGPVGITVAVGAASSEGVGNLLSIVAIISISLALINIVPIPALDGGRLLIVLIEGALRRRLNPRVVTVVNNVAFLLLIPLMLVISFFDVYKLLG